MAREILPENLEERDYEGVKKEVNPDFSAPKTEYDANISNYASMDRVGKKDIGLQSLEDFPSLAGEPAEGILGSPLWEGLPKGEVGQVSVKSFKVQLK